MVEWTKETISQLPKPKIETLRENALRGGHQAIADLCVEVLLELQPARSSKGSSNEDRQGYYVSEFHFICPNELGVIRDADGSIWTGTWVVAERHLNHALQYNSLVCLHSAKAEPSYLQGVVKGWRKSPRDKKYTGPNETQINEGIDFLIDLSDVHLPWVGDGTGEKGYAWKPLSQ